MDDGDAMRVGPEQPQLVERAGKVSPVCAGTGRYPHHDRVQQDAGCQCGSSQVLRVQSLEPRSIFVVTFAPLYPSSGEFPRLNQRPHRGG